jgi:hypothetical protein
MKRLLAGSVASALFVCGAAQAHQQPVPAPAANPGQSGTQNPGQPATNPSGQTTAPPQTGQNPIGQPNRTPLGQNPGIQPGQTPATNPLGKPGRITTGQNPGATGQGTAINRNGQTGQNGMINGQPRVNPVGQGAVLNTGPNGTQLVPGLYQNAEISRSLKLTNKQIDQLNAANTQIQNRYQNQLSQVGTLTGEQRAQALERLRANQWNDFYRSTGSIFTPQQLQRYRQLQYQYEGPRAFLDPAVRQQLNLTDSQVRQFQLLQQNALPPQAFLQNADGSVRTNGIRDYNAYQSSTNERMNAILSQEQRDRWHDLVGDRYNFGPYVSSIFVR